MKRGVVSSQLSCSSWVGRWDTSALQVHSSTRRHPCISIRQTDVTQTDVCQSHVTVTHHTHVICSFVS